MFDWHGYLRLAHELADRDDEAAQRSAISRAYYAAFSLARQLLESEGVPLDAEGSIHSQVWDTFRNSADDVRYYIGIDGKGLRNFRNSADYENEFVDVRKRTGQAIRKAESIVSSLVRVSFA